MAMRIAICNRSKKQLESLKNMIYFYAAQKRLEVAVDCYFFGEDMLNSGNKYNILFIGYYLAGKNGLEITKTLREEDGLCAIIFTSVETNYIFDALRVNPHAFLVAPVSKEKLFCALDDFFEQHGTDYPLFLKNGRDTVFLNTAQIVYLEADNKHCLVFLEDETLDCSKTLSGVFKELPKSHFFRISRAFVINLFYVRRYNSETVLLKNGQQLPIGRKYSKEFKDYYCSFVNPKRI